MRTYIIAEAGVNHNGSLEMAKELVSAAAEAGADAVKFQTFKADLLVSRTAPKAEYQTRTTGREESQHEMIRKLELDRRQHEMLLDACRECGIQFLSTPFDHDSVDLLALTFDLPVIKVSSGDLTNAPLLLRIAAMGKPVILGTGMATLGEIEDALGVLALGYTCAAQPSLAAFRAAFCSVKGQQALKEKVTLLHCTTEYPAPLEEVNLRVMETLRGAFGLAVGYSDHTEGIAVPLAAAALGAEVIEKHFTLDRTLPGPDHKASLEVRELKQMVQGIRSVEKALGRGIKHPTQSEIKNLPVARKSLVAASSITEGEIYTDSNVAVKRPGSGLSPMQYWDLLGKKASRDSGVDEVIAP